MSRPVVLFGASLFVTSLAAASCGSTDKSKPARDEGGAGATGTLAGASSAVAGAPGKPSAPQGGAGGEGGSATEAAGAGGGGAETPLAGEGGTNSASQGGEGGALGGAGGATPIIDPASLVFNTGLDDDGVVLEGGSVDPHWTLIQSPDTTLMGPEAIVTTNIADGYWLAQSEQSKWIAPSANQSYPGADPCNAQGVYVWRTTFDLTGYDLERFSLSGGWAADNYGTDLRLNGVSTGFTSSGYGAFAPFTIDSGFVSGVNTLDFEVTDIGCPNAVRVELSADIGAGGAGGAGTL